MGHYSRNSGVAMAGLDTVVIKTHIFPANEGLAPNNRSLSTKSKFQSFRLRVHSNLRVRKTSSGRVLNILTQKNINRFVNVTYAC